MGCRPGRDCSRASAPEHRLTVDENLRKCARVLDWLIVGGGIHGALLARVLVEEAGVGLDRLRVLDPHPEPLARFRQCAAATGLDYLRSSVVHHLDGDPMSLRRFAERQGRRGELHGIYQRPSIGLFDDHCDAVTERLGLRSAWIRGEALEIARAEGGGLRVETTAGRARCPPRRARAGIRRPAVVAGLGRGAALALAPRSVMCSSPGSGSRTRSGSRGRSSSAAGSRRSSSRSGWPARRPGNGHPARPPRGAGPRVRRRLAVDGPARAGASSRGSMAVASAGV